MSTYEERRNLGIVILEVRKEEEEEEEKEEEEEAEDEGRKMKRYLGHLRIHLITPNVGLEIGMAESLSCLRLLAFGRRGDHVFRVTQSFALAIHARPQSRFLFRYVASVTRLESLRRDLLAAFHHRLQLQQEDAILVSSDSHFEMVWRVSTLK